MHGNLRFVRSVVEIDLGTLPILASWWHHCQLQYKAYAYACVDLLDIPPTLSAPLRSFIPCVPFIPTP